MWGILLMVLLDAALHLVYELSYRRYYAHRRLARLGSSGSWSPHRADRAARPLASREVPRRGPSWLSTFSVLRWLALPILVVRIISFAPCCYSTVVDIYKCLMGETFKPRKVTF